MMPSLMIDHLSINLRSGMDNLVSEISFAIKEGESLILLAALAALDADKLAGAGER